MARKSNKSNSGKTGYKQKSKNPAIIMSVTLFGLFLWIMSQLAGPGTPLALGSKPVSAQVVNGVQVISMNLSAAGYSPNNITVRRGIPVRINTDATSDAGCVRGLMIPDFNINKALNIGQDSFIFTPDKTGTFNFSCQMRMSTGVITVT